MVAPRHNVGTFWKIEEGGDFAKAANTPIPGKIVVSIVYLIILRTGVTENPVDSEKKCRLEWNPGRISRTISYKSTGKPNPKESDSGGQWLWLVRKSHTGYRGPSQHCGCATSTRMWSNGRQWGNGEPCQNQPNIISEPNLITRDHFGDFQAIAGTKNTYQKETPATKRTALNKKTKNAKYECYYWTHRRTCRLDHTSATCNLPKIG